MEFLHSLLCLLEIQYNLYNDLHTLLKKLLCPSEQPVVRRHQRSRPSVTDPFKHSGSVGCNQRARDLATFIHKHKNLTIARAVAYLWIC